MPARRAVLRLVRAARTDAHHDPAVRCGGLGERIAGETRGAGVNEPFAAVRMLFDWLITGQVVPFNPASAVRGPKHAVKTGKTPVLDGASGAG